MRILENVIAYAYNKAYYIKDDKISYSYISVSKMELVSNGFSKLFNNCYIKNDITLKNNNIEILTNEFSELERVKECHVIKSIGNMFLLLLYIPDGIRSYDTFIFELHKDFSFNYTNDNFNILDQL